MRSLGVSANCNLKHMQLEAYSKFLIKILVTVFDLSPDAVDATTSNAFTRTLNLKRIAFLNFEVRR